MEEWCQKWQLSLSVDKCQVLPIGSFSPFFHFSLFGEALPFCEIVKDLGVHIDSNLSFSHHCSAIIKKARRVSGVVLKCFSSGKVSLLLRAYTCYVRPILEAASPAWNSMSIKDSKRLESVQRHYTKTLYLKCGLSKKASYEQRLRRLGLDTLKVRRFKLDLSLCFKIYNNLTFCPNLLVRKTISRELQHNHRLQKEITGGKQRLLAFHNRVVAAWNSLPDRAIEGSETTFRQHLTCS